MRTLPPKTDLTHEACAALRDAIAGGNPAPGARSARQTIAEQARRTSPNSWTYPVTVEAERRAASHCRAAG